MKSNSRLIGMWQCGMIVYRLSGKSTPISDIFFDLLILLGAGHLDFR